MDFFHRARGHILPLQIVLQASKKAQGLGPLICRRHPPISATRGATWNQNVSELDRAPQIAVS